MRKWFSGSTGMVAAFLIGAVVASAATAGAASLITGREIAKQTITARNIKDRTITKRKLARGVAVAGPRGPQGLPGGQGAKGDTGAAGPSNAFVTTHVGLTALTGTPATVLSLDLPAGSYTFSAESYAYPSGAAADGRDQIICSIYDSASHAAGGMPSQLVVPDNGVQFSVLGAASIAAGPVQVICNQIAMGALDPSLNVINTKLVATHVGDVTTG